MKKVPSKISNIGFQISFPDDHARATDKNCLPTVLDHGFTGTSKHVARLAGKIMSKKKSKPHILIVEARFYDDMSDALLEGATEALKAVEATFDVVTVPGALEIPAAISMALDGADEGGTEYDGFVALGMVIRGETYHFDIVANESARALMDLAVSESLAIGNGILTCDTDEQAWARAKRSEMDKGGFAARAALSMVALKKKFGA
jgi:6,7-dimethyl-8-ribityllumazine synthase